MEWGKLGEGPFDATVWGTVAEWVGAAGAILAAIVAVGIYARDRWLNARVQARQVIYRPDTGAGISIRNSSDQPVFNVFIRWDIGRYPKQKFKSRRHLNKLLSFTANEWDVLEAGIEQTAAFPRWVALELNVELIPRLFLQDVRGIRWEIRPLGRRRVKPRKISSVEILWNKVTGSLVADDISRFWEKFREATRPPRDRR